MYYCDSPFTTIIEDIEDHNIARKICQKLKDRFGKHFVLQSTQLSFDSQYHIYVKGQFPASESKEFKTFAREALRNQSLVAA